MNIHASKQLSTWPSALAWILAIVGIVVLILKYTAPISDIDLWWHMVIGRHILETGQLIVNHAIFTWTPATSYHVYNTWIADCLLYLIYYHTGAIGIFALKCLAYASFFTLAAYFAVRLGLWTNPLVWLILTVGIVLAFYAQLALVELFSFIFMCVTVFVYFTIKNMGAHACVLCYLFPIIVLLWVNSHGAFVLSAIFFLAVGGGKSSIL